MPGSPILNPRVTAKAGAGIVKTVNFGYGLDPARGLPGLTMCGPTGRGETREGRPAGAHACHGGACGPQGISYRRSLPAMEMMEPAYFSAFKNLAFSPTTSAMLTVRG